MLDLRFDLPRGRCIYVTTNGSAIKPGLDTTRIFFSRGGVAGNQKSRQQHRHCNQSSYFHKCEAPNAYNFYLYHPCCQASRRASRRAFFSN
jgi:hypothetical protein